MSCDEDSRLGADGGRAGQCASTDVMTASIRSIAFEGPDLTGKTSLADGLQKLMPYALWPRFSITTQKPALETTGSLLSDVAKAFYGSLSKMGRTMPFVLDRCYVSTYVYGRVFKRGIDIEGLRRVARSLNMTVVYVYTPLKVLLDRLKHRGDDWVVSDTLERVFFEYEAWYRDNLFGDSVMATSTVHGRTIAAMADELVIRLAE